MKEIATNFDFITPSEIIAVDHKQSRCSQNSQSVYFRSIEPLHKKKIAIFFEENPPAFNEISELNQWLNNCLGFFHQDLFKSDDDKITVKNKKVFIINGHDVNTFWYSGTKASGEGRGTGFITSIAIVQPTYHTAPIAIIIHNEQTLSSWKPFELWLTKYQSATEKTMTQVLDGFDEIISLL